MNALLERLRHALLQGAALATATVAVGCYDSDEGGRPGLGNGGRDAAQPKPDPSITVTAGRPGPAPDAAVDAMAPLQPYPLDKLGCFGEEHDGGYYGQCCVARVCEPPVNGVCSASGPKHGLPGGSGSCSCNPFGPGSEFQGTTFLGPYAPNPVDSAHASIPENSCCYLIASITCTGRPLIVGGAFVVAEVEMRSDWAALA